MSFQIRTVFSQFISRRAMIISTIIASVFFLCMSLSPAIAAGGCEFVDPSDPLGVDCVGAGNPSLSDEDPRIIVGRIIQVALGLIGIITTVLIVWAGFRWMTSAGNEEQIASAKKTLSAAVIGLIIILLAYSLTNFILDQLYTATSGNVLY